MGRRVAKGRHQKPSRFGSAPPPSRRAAAAAADDSDPDAISDIDAGIMSDDVRDDSSVDEFADSDDGDRRPRDELALDVGDDDSDNEFAASLRRRKSSKKAKKQQREQLAADDDNDNDNDDDDDAMDDDATFADEQRRLGKAWGKRSRTYYNQGESSDEEEQEAEGVEARRLADEQARLLHVDDYADTYAALAKRAGGKSGAAAASASSQAMQQASSSSSSSSTTAALERIERDATKWTRGEKLARLKLDAPELAKLLADLRSFTDELRSHILPLVEQVARDELPTNRGLSFLHTKAHLLLGYCANVTFYLMLKASGRPVRDHPVLDELVRLRTYIERMRPLDSKLRYQVDKLLRVAKQGALAKLGGGSARSVDPLQHRPLLAAQAASANSERNDDDGDGDADDADDDGDAAAATKASGKKGDKKKSSSASASATYKAPKIAAMAYDAASGGGGGDSAAAKARKRERRELEMLKRSKMLSYLENEYGDAPEQESTDLLATSRVKAKGADERERYEEENFVRLNLTRAQKKEQKALWRKHISGKLSSGLEDLEEFTALSDALGKNGGGGGGDDTATRSSLGDDGVGDLGGLLAQRRSTFKGKKGAGVLNVDGDNDGDDDTGRAPAQFDYDPDADELIAQVQRTKRARDAEKERKSGEVKRAKQFVPSHVDEVGDGAKRKPGYAIEKNKGLMPYRKKEDRNPRVRKRRQYEKAVKKRKGQVVEMREQGGHYGGEATGIRTQTTKSRKL